MFGSGCRASRWVCAAVFCATATIDAVRAEASLIPRRILFGNPDRVSPQLSPDGTKLAFLAPAGERMNVWVGPNDDPDRARPVTREVQRGIRHYYWAYTSQHILYLRDEGGDENWRVFVADLSGGEPRDLTPYKGCSARIQEISPRCPSEILIALNRRSPSLHDIYRVDILSGDMSLVAENPAHLAFVGFLTDPDYNVRFAFRVASGGGEEIHRPDRGRGWELWQKIPMEDAVATEPIGFDRSGQRLYMRDSRGRDTAALCAVNLTNDRSTVLAADPRVDAGAAMIHPTDRTVQAVAFEHDRKRWKVLDPSIEGDFATLRAVAHGDFSVVSRTLDDAQWIVAYEMDDGPTAYYRYERPSGAAQLLFVNRSALRGLSLATMRPVVIRSRDGLELVSFVTLPRDAAESGELAPKTPGPMVLVVHGGPWARDSWGFNATHQWLANRGYAVLSVNFRGSTGFGKAFANAGNRQWGAKMHEDLIDAVEWAVRERIADPARIGILGASYGGYATLVALTQTPETFACGVDIVGPSNLVTLLESIPPYWEPMVESFAKRVGDHRTPEGRAFLRERSPLTHAGKIRRPLLIGQGANDPRVKQAESDQIVRAMIERNIPVTYVLYPDEGHGFQRPENRLSFQAVTEAFLAEHLGGRAEPFGEDFEGSSLVVPVGREHIPGLTDALRRP